MYIFPTHRLNPEFVTPDVVERVVSGGTALSGAEDVIATDGGGRVVVEYGPMALDTPETQRIWNAWSGHLGGGVVACLVPLVSLSTAPRPWSGNGPRPAFDFGGDDPMFPTSVGYRVRTIAAETVGAAALRATEIAIAIAKGSPIQGGEWFSVGGRAHRIVRVVSRAGMVATVKIDPPLRMQVEGGTAVEFEWPVLKARLQIGQRLAPTLTLGLFGDSVMTWVEAP